MIVDYNAEREMNSFFHETVDDEYNNKHNAELQRKPPPENQSNILYTPVVFSHVITILKYTRTLNQYV